jgi:hypothetical protein
MAGAISLKLENKLPFYLMSKLLISKPQTYFLSKIISPVISTVAIYGFSKI